MAGRFARVETRRRAGKFLLGLLADLPRKNCWTIAEHAGDADPHGMQHLLARASWDTDGVRDDLRDYVTDGLGDPDAVLVVDETGDLKKGVGTVGVQRQYTGTAGRIENAQVAVYLTYAGARGHAMIDRELYLPKSWTADPERLDEAGVPDAIGFATKPALATGMLIRALNAGIEARWVAGDEVYGADPALRTECELRRVGYVLGIGCDRRIPTQAGSLRADEITAGLPTRAWQRLSAGAGAKGQRFYDWALISHPDPAGTADPARGEPADTECWWLLVRRHRDTGELAFYRCYSPEPVPLRELVRVAGRRWTVEESFQAGKGLAGLDEHQVRRWISWQRWTLLAMTAHALLAVIAAREHTLRPAPDGLIALTRNEIRRLFVRFVIEPGRTLACPQAWSRWRRRHQHRARTSHYQRQELGQRQT
ncbi:IS701 family transposase [Pseudonocardia sp. RS11V-5]|uniref:IS701 family transposase n=1 Tax=Pseudonocardia terrae TaxID=2905831 RepID=UPI001E5506F9|nr:IS701 family transposase [Pseudonocardia terrae]MCE3556558.1 IS701 family transposase [Pseudonocardia terrae]